MKRYLDLERQFTITKSSDVLIDLPWRIPTVSQCGLKLRVYQRNDLFDLNHIDDFGRTNIQRMKKGIAPIGKDGLEINLHHVIQNEPGPMTEILSSTHSKYDRMLHMYSNQWDKTWVGPDGIRRTYNNAPPSTNRRPFNQWKKTYWKTRALDFLTP
ncbi:HNH/ENDO VII family nuclease [Photorhabdus sp. RM96S]|uniref:HNH/ENDO VII family nuclease n=1 Tax=Photorhabdus sp. RM96S TaxID=3342822 RepID=UPI0036D84464